MVLVTRSALATENLGRTLGSILQKGAFVALFGDLGGGKTCITRGIVAGAAPESLHLVASPTFAIMNEYPGRVPIYHFDFYRLSNGYEILELGFDDYFQGAGICIAEWSERLESLLPQDHLKIHLEYSGGDCRKISLAASGAQSQILIESLKALIKVEDFL